MKPSRLHQPEAGWNSQNGATDQHQQSPETLRSSAFSLHKLSRSFRKQRGAAAVEFAVVAPILMLLLFGMVEYGRMVMVQQMLTNATREGARRAVLDGITTADVKQAVREYCSKGGITVYDNEVSAHPEPRLAAFGDPITVSVQVPFTRVSWLPAPWFLGSSKLSATSVMRRESVQ